jgi:hypothetical protein
MADRTAIVGFAMTPYVGERKGVGVSSRRSLKLERCVLMKAISMLSGARRCDRFQPVGLAQRRCHVDLMSKRGRKG